MDLPLFLERAVKSIADGVLSISGALERREKTDAFRLQFAERAGYLVTALALKVNSAQALPPANGYMILSCTGSPAALGLCVGEQSGSQQWGLGVFIRTGAKHDRPRPSFIYSSIAQSVVVAYVVGGADIDDKRSYPLVADTARRTVASIFEAGANTPPPAAIGTTAALVAAGTTTIASTAALVAGTTYLVRAQARFSASAAGAVGLSLRANAVQINLNDLITVPIAGVYDTRFGGDFLYSAPNTGALDIFFQSAATAAGQCDGSISISRQTS